MFSASGVELVSQLNAEKVPLPVPVSRAVCVRP
jgi:hypothetical protein